MYLQRRFDDAVYDYSRAIQIDNTVREVFFNRALAYTWLRQDVQAQADVEMAVGMGLGRNKLEGAITQIKRQR